MTVNKGMRRNVVAPLFPPAKKETLAGDRGGETGIRPIESLFPDKLVLATNESYQCKHLIDPIALPGKCCAGIRKIGTDYCMHHQN
jgi:hypothetical protein